MSEATSQSHSQLPTRLLGCLFPAATLHQCVEGRTNRTHTALLGVVSLQHHHPGAAARKRWEAEEERRREATEIVICLRVKGFRHLRESASGLDQQRAGKKSRGAREAACRSDFAAFASPKLTLSGTRAHRRALCSRQRRVRRRRDRAAGEGARAGEGQRAEGADSRPALPTTSKARSLPPRQPTFELRFRCLGAGSALDRVFARSCCGLNFELVTRAVDGRRCSPLRRR